MNHPIAFRPYTASDRAALIGIIREAWHYDRFASPKTAARMARLFLDSCLASQTFTQVAVSGDVPVGIIMAKDRLQHRPAFMHRLRQWRSLAALVAHREGREVMQIFADVHHVDDHLLASCSRHYDSEIVFFAISGHMRGQGLGRRLFGHAAQHLREKGRQHCFLFTDTSCNYAFYEHLGLTRRAEKALTLNVQGERATMCFFLYDFAL